MLQEKESNNEIKCGENIECRTRNEEFRSLDVERISNVEHGMKNFEVWRGREYRMSNME